MSNSPGKVHVVNLAQKLGTFSETWSPRIVGEVNDMHVKVVKQQGEFVWHHHDHEDEMFLVLKGTLTMQLRTGDQHVHAGEFIIVPKGVEHCPRTDGCEVLLFEPKDTLNTGNVVNERTKAHLERI